MKIDPAVKQDLKHYFQEKLNSLSEQVVIVAANQLNDEEKNQLTSSIAELKRVKNINYQVDKNILAGVLIKIGSKTIDLTLNGQLSNLKHLLYESA